MEGLVLDSFFEEFGETLFGAGPVGFAGELDELGYVFFVAADDAGFEGFGGGFWRDCVGVLGGVHDGCS